MCIHSSNIHGTCLTQEKALRISWTGLGWVCSSYVVKLWIISTEHFLSSLCMFYSLPCWLSDWFLKIAPDLRKPSNCCAENWEQLGVDTNVPSVLFGLTVVQYVNLLWKLLSAAPQSILFYQYSSTHLSFKKAITIGLSALVVVTLSVADSVLAFCLHEGSGLWLHDTSAVGFW